MNQEEFCRQMDELFELDSGTVALGDELQQIEGWSSLTFLGLLALLDEVYGVSARPDAILSCATIGDLVNYVEQSLAQRAAA